MPTPSYDELSDAPVYDELSDAPAYGELSGSPAPSLYDLRAAEFDAQAQPEKQFGAPSSIGEALKEGWQAGNEAAAAHPILGAPARALALLPRLKAQTVQDAIDVMTPGLPLDTQSQPPSLTAQRTAGAVNVGRGVADSLASPLGIATLGIGGAPAIAQRAISGAFLADMATSVPELARTAGAASVSGTPQEKVEAYGNLATVPAFAAGIGLHALAPRGGVELPDIPNPDIVARNAIIEGAQQMAVDTGLHRTAAALEETKNASTIRGSAPLPEPEIRPPMDEGTPLRQQGEAPQEGLPGAAEVPQGEAQEIAAMPHQDFVKWARQQKGGYTTKAYELGEKMQTPEGAAKLRELEAQTEAARQAAFAAEDIEAAMNLANKKQFFTEALESAVGVAKNKSNLTAEQVAKAKAAPAIVPEKPASVPENAAIVPKSEPSVAQNADFVTSGALGVEGLSPAGVNQPLSQGSQLAQLTEVIKTRKPSPNASISSRIGDAVKTATAEWAKGKDAVTAGLGKLKAVSTALADSYANLPKWTSFEDAVGKWSGADNASGVEVRDFQNKINKTIPSKLRQEAITNWIQADGSPAVLQQRAAASKPDVRAGYEEALKLTPDEQVLARNIGQYLDSRLQEGIDTGLLKNGVDNYVTQVWKKENPVTNKLQSDLFGGGNLNPNFKYSRQRIFDSYFEGEQAGFKPQNKSIGALIAHYDAAFNKSLASRSFIKALHEGSTPDGDPIVEVSGKTIPVPQGAGVPEAFLIKPRANDAVTKDGRPYRVVDHWALRDWKWQTEGPDGQPVLVQGDLLVHPDYVGKLKNMLGKSALTSPEGIASYTTRPALKLGALAKQTKLSLSGFHLTQEAVHGLGHRVNPANLVELDMKAPEQRALVDHGLQVADPRAAELFGEGLAGGGLVGKIPGLGKVQVAFNDWLFKDYIPRLKMTMALDALERNRKVYSKDIKSGKITDDQIQALTARQANAAFGELNYRMMGRNPTVQDFLRLTTLAPDFLEARSRFVGQALKPYGREQQVALGLMGATLYVTGRILNQWLDDDPHWDKPFAVYHNGREYRLRTVLGDVQHLVTDPRRFFYNRLSAFSRIATEAMTGKDDRGMNRGFWDQAEDAARWFIPISAETRSDTSHSQAVAGSLGVSSRPYTARTDLYDLVDKWKKNNPDPKIQEQYEQAKQETRPESAYKKLRDYVRKDDAEAALKEYENLRKTHSDKQIWQAFTIKPFTGGLASENAFHDSLTPEQQKLYHKAIMEQVAEGQKLSEMIKKAPKPAGF